MVPTKLKSCGYTHWIASFAVQSCHVQNSANQHKRQGSFVGTTRHSVVWLCICFLTVTLMVGEVDAAQSKKYLNALINEYGDENARTIPVEGLAQLRNDINKHRDLGPYTGNGSRNDHCRDGNTSLACNLTICLSPSAVINSSSKTDSLDVYQFLNICPQLLYEAASGICGKPVEKKVNVHKKPSNLEVWGLGMACVFVISVASLGGAVLFPFMNKRFYKQFLMFLIGLAIGSLSGSAIFHLIPQAFDLLDNGHDYLFKALMIIGGIMLFFMLEHIMKIHAHFLQKRRNKRSGLGKTSNKYNLSRDDSQAVVLQTAAFNKSEGGEDNPLNGTAGDAKIHFVNGNGKAPHYDSIDVGISVAQSIKAHDDDVPHMNVCGHEHGLENMEGKSTTQVIAAVAWMIILGDGLHNFIDGLGIGAAFTESTFSGLAISLAVLCEEFPHELGDFAVLLNSGMTMKQAMFFNFLSACTCFLGLVCGILLGQELEAATFFIFALAAGMFLYISLVDMLPELNVAIQEAIDIGEGGKMLITITSGLMLGFMLMFLTALYGTQIDLSGIS